MDASRRITHGTRSWRKGTDTDNWPVHSHSTGLFIGCQPHMIDEVVTQPLR